LELEPLVVLPELIEAQQEKTASLALLLQMVVEVVVLLVLQQQMVVAVVVRDLEELKELELLGRVTMVGKQLLELVVVVVPVKLDKITSQQLVVPVVLVVHRM
jgi:hypothetical protein